MRVVRGNDLPLLPASHEDPQNPGVFKRVLAAKGDLLSGRVQMINWALLPVASAFRRHYHEDMEEIFIIVRGQAEMRAGGQTVHLAEGDAVVVAPREVHEMRNVGDHDVHYVVLGISTELGGKTVVVQE